MTDIKSARPLLMGAVCCNQQGQDFEEVSEVGRAGAGKGGRGHGVQGRGKSRQTWSGPMRQGRKKPKTEVDKAEAEKQ